MARNKQLNRGQIRLVVFHTRLGWMALLRDGQSIARLWFGYAERSQLLRATSAWKSVLQKPDAAERQWIETLQSYARGEPAELNKLPIELPNVTAFQRRVIEVCRSIPRGDVLSYGQVAQLAGSPGAARAVGNVMKTNRIPLLVPCHRVVGSNGLGGYSAPRGLSMKQKLLTLEKS